MTTQFNNTGVKAETCFAQVINNDAELKQASGGFFLTGGILALKAYEKVTGNKVLPTF